MLRAAALLGRLATGPCRRRRSRRPDPPGPSGPPGPPGPPADPGAPADRGRRAGPAGRPAAARRPTARPPTEAARPAAGRPRRGRPEPRPPTEALPTEAVPTDGAAHGARRPVAAAGTAPGAVRAGRSRRWSSSGAGGSATARARRPGHAQTADRRTRSFGHTCRSRWRMPPSPWRAAVSCATRGRSGLRRRSRSVGCREMTDCGAGCPSRSWAGRRTRSAASSPFRVGRRSVRGGGLRRPTAGRGAVSSSAVSASRPSRYCSTRWFHPQPRHTSTTKTWNSRSVIASTGSSAQRARLSGGLLELIAVDVVHVGSGSPGGRSGSAPRSARRGTEQRFSGTARRRRPHSVPTRPACTSRSSARL